METYPEQWALDLWRDACQASQDAFHAADGMFANDPEAIQQSRYSDQAAALAIQAAFAEREAWLVAALESVEAAMIRGGDGRILDTGWSITKLNEARPLILAALKAKAGS